jgi:hypothetical protein
MSEPFSSDWRYLDQDETDIPLDALDAFISSRIYTKDELKALRDEAEKRRLKEEAAKTVELEEARKAAAAAPERGIVGTTEFVKDDGTKVKMTMLSSAYVVGTTPPAKSEILKASISDWVRRALSFVVLLALSYVFLNEGPRNEAIGFIQDAWSQVTSWFIQVLG